MNNYNELNEKIYFNLDLDDMIVFSLDNNISNNNYYDGDEEDSDSDDNNDEYVIDSLMDSFMDILNTNELTLEQEKIVLNNCDYICNVCNHNYLHKCPECKSSKYFEYEIEEQKFREKHNLPKRKYYIEERPYRKRYKR